MTKRYNVFDFDRYEGRMTKSEVIAFLRRRLDEGYKTKIEIVD